MTQPPFGDEIRIMEIEEWARRGDGGPLATQFVGDLGAAIAHRDAAIADLTVSPAGSRRMSPMPAECPIPAVAVDDAHRLLHRYTPIYRDDVERALEAAAPHIAAAALRQAADDYLAEAGSYTTGAFAAWLRRRADDLDGRQPTPDTREAVQARLRQTEATP